MMDRFGGRDGPFPSGGQNRGGPGDVFGGQAMRLPTQEELKVQAIMNGWMQYFAKAKCPRGCRPSAIQVSVPNPGSDEWGQDASLRCAHCLSYWRINQKCDVIYQEVTTHPRGWLGEKGPKGVRGPDLSMSKEGD